MTKKPKNLSRLTFEIIEAAKDMRRIGLLDDAAFEEITNRHSGDVNIQAEAEEGLRPVVSAKAP